MRGRYICLYLKNEDIPAYVTGCEVRAYTEEMVRMISASDHYTMIVVTADIVEPGPEDGVLEIIPMPR